VVILLKQALGQERLRGLDLLIAGDDVRSKKPDPLIYTLAAQRLGVSPDR
jgi:beta-phosphoglucomutase-like phosphatase (HAD superfamily)